MVALTDGEKNLRKCTTVYTQYRRVTDRQTDRQTSCHSIVRAMHTRRAVQMTRKRHNCMAALAPIDIGYVTVTYYK